MALPRGPKKAGKPQSGAELRLLRGTRTRSRHAALNAAPEAPPLPYPLKAPRWLSLRAREFWHSEIAPRRLPLWLEVEAIEYCTNRAIWEEELQKLETEGKVLENLAGTSYVNPRVKLVKDLTKSIRELSICLGLHTAPPVIGNAEEQAAAEAKSKKRFFK